MGIGRTNLFAAANGQHLYDAASQSPSKISVRLYAIDDNYAIRIESRNTEHDVEVITSGPDLPNIHARFNGDAKAFGCDSILGQNSGLARRCGASMTAHRRYYEGPSTRRDQHV